MFRIVVYLLLLGLFIWFMRFIINRNVVPWPYEVWPRYKSVGYDFSFKYPPHINIAEEPINEGPILKPFLHLELRDAVGLFGYVDVVSSDRYIAFKNYEKSEPVILDTGKQLIVNNTKIQTKIYLSEDKSRVDKLVTETPIEYNTGYKVVFTLSHRLDEEQKEIEAKEAFYKRMLQSLKFGP